MFNAPDSFVKADKIYGKKNAMMLLGAPRAKEPALQSLTQLDSVNTPGQEIVLVLGQMPPPKLRSCSHYKLLV